MLNLLRKDFIALKSSLWMILMYLAVFSIAFIPSHDMSIYLVGIYTAFASISLATMIDIKTITITFWSRCRLAESILCKPNTLQPSF